MRPFQILSSLVLLLLSNTASGKTVYLEGGSYLKGQFISAGSENITILGRGILSGEEYPVRSANHMITFNGVNNVNIEGITIIHAPNTIARRCVIWQMGNGAPFQIGWGGETEHALRHVYDCDVIRVKHEWDNENEAVFCAIHGSSGHQKNYLFENVTFNGKAIEKMDPAILYVDPQTTRNVRFAVQ